MAWRPSDFGATGFVPRASHFYDSDHDSAEGWIDVSGAGAEVVRLATSGDVLAAVSSSEPADDSGAMVQRSTYPVCYQIGAGERLWVQAINNNNRVSAQIYVRST